MPTRFTSHGAALAALALAGPALAAPPDTTDALLERDRAKVEALAQRLWETPETALQEVPSSAALAGALEKAGFEVTRGIAGMPTAFVATAGSGLRPSHGEAETGGTASSDIAEVAAIVPLAKLGVVTRPIGTAAHHWAQTSAAAHPVGRKGMLVAAKVLGASVVDLLQDPGAVKAAKPELAEATKGKPYASPLAPDATPRT